jgi:hypothetical protein
LIELIFLTDCGFCCHLKCMANICRICVHVIASETGGYTYTKDICPERGLSAQAYRCAECFTRITFSKFKLFFLIIIFLLTNIFLFNICVVHTYNFIHYKLSQREYLYHVLALLLRVQVK